MLTVPLRCTRAPSLKTVTAVIGASSIGVASSVPSAIGFSRTAAFTIILPHERYCSLRLTRSPFARRRARVICGAVASV